MDNLTHTLLGVAIARAGLSRRFGRGTTAILAIGSNLPDVDAPGTWLLGLEPYFVRRTLTHSLPGLFVLAAIAVPLFRLRYRDFPKRALFALLLLAEAAHVFYDLVNSYGVELLRPFSGWRPELAWIFIVDPVLWALLLGPVLLAWASRRRFAGPTTFRVALALVGAYTALCGSARALASRRLERTVAAERLVPAFSYVFPEALGPHRFRGVVEAGGAYRTYRIALLDGRVEPREVWWTRKDDPRVATVRGTAVGARLDDLFMAPVWRPIEGTDEVEAFDLRFRSFVLTWRRSPFVYRIAPTADGRGSIRRERGSPPQPDARLGEGER